MHLKIREDIPSYLADLKSWLAQNQNIPVEAMDDFFTWMESRKKLR